MEELIRPDRPAMEMSNETAPLPLQETLKVNTEMKRRGRKPSLTTPTTQTAPTSKQNPMSDFAKEIVGKLVTFCGTVESGIDTIEGVPMSIIQDPNNRWFIKFFSSDGSRAFLYLDQVAAFYTRNESVESAQHPQQGDNRRQMLQPGETEADVNSFQGQSGPYYDSQLGEQLPDTQYVRRGAARGPSGPVKHIARPDGAN